MGVTAAGIVKGFGQEPALRGVDLAIRSGELMALLGPSGSGKTTLLRVVAGLERSDAGRILFGDEDMTDVPVQRRQVGFVFQHYALFRHLRVFDNVAFGLRSGGRNLGRSAITDRVRELLRLVQLEGYEGRFPAQLSGGQRQRVALARALAVEPRVLLLDEPFGALDARVRRDLRRSLRDVHDATGQTTIFVTHDQDEALELADRVAILNDGRIEQVGTPDEVHDAPNSAFVMSFVGESTRIAGISTGGEMRVGDRQLLAAPTGLPDGPVELFVRPHEVALTDRDDGWPARVIAVRRAAGGRRAEIRFEASGDIIEIAAAGDAALARGDVVRVDVQAGRAFPAGDARRR